MPNPKKISNLINAPIYIAAQLIWIALGNNAFLANGMPFPLQQAHPLITFG
jgi:hypothetical protein